ncbi:DUF2946 domain-containing protein [Mycetohabitans sp. B2]|uniref:DUF2946 domain-containing protein n=1 Tax=Mycetohabitans sp. B2 TaxID=2841274 RepID=UPI001F3EDB12|nr:DUF2946 domain-containing protein [Mycetohabitans sp. B2]MCF7694954.1 DUF2946 domain-containing protein [Mycetohabitans sp. B2]
MATDNLDPSDFTIFTVVSATLVRCCPMPHRRTQKLTAWLGLTAIWLIVVMPLASQWLSHAGRGVDTVLCSAATTGERASAHGSAHVGGHLDACGYCSLLAHSPAIGAPQVATLMLQRQRAATLPVSEGVPRPTSRHLVSYPRAPPGTV